MDIEKFKSEMAEIRATTIALNKQTMDLCRERPREAVSQRDPSPLSWRTVVGALVVGTASAVIAYHLVCWSSC